MSRLTKELSLAQGIGLLTTSLLGTGIFIVPAVAATLAGRASLWAWLLLILLVLPIAFTFAQLGKRFPHAGGAPALIGRAFGARLERATALLFLAVIPVGLPAALKMASGFWHALFDLDGLQELAIQLATLGLIYLLGQRPARASGRVQMVIALVIVATVAAIWWGAGSSGVRLPLPSIDDLNWSAMPAALAVMFWCFVGIEAFTHMGEEFRNPQRDFLPALLIGVLLAGAVYWSFSAAVLGFGVYGDERTNGSSLPLLIGQLWGERISGVAALIGYLACFASINIYLQGFARLVWSLADEGKLPRQLAVRNAHGVPARALTLVVAACGLFAILSWWQSIPIAELIQYANGNFVLVYLFSMAAGWVLLPGFRRWPAAVGTLLCALTLFTLGMQALYALAMLVLFILLGRLGQQPTTADLRRL